VVKRELFIRPLKSRLGHDRSSRLLRFQSVHPTFDSRDPLLDARLAAELDLHGFSAIEARSAVRSFLETWQRRKPGTVVHIMKTLLQGELSAMVAEWGLDDADGGYKVQLR